MSDIPHLYEKGYKFCELFSEKDELVMWKDTEASRANIDRIKVADSERIAQEAAHKELLADKLAESNERRAQAKEQEKIDAATAKAARNKRY